MPEIFFAWILFLLDEMRQAFYMMSDSAEQVVLATVRTLTEFWPATWEAIGVLGSAAVLAHTGFQVRHWLCKRRANKPAKRRANKPAKPETKEKADNRKRKERLALMGSKREIIVPTPRADPPPAVKQRKPKITPITDGVRIDYPQRFGGFPALEHEIVAATQGLADVANAAGQSVEELGRSMGRALGRAYTTNSNDSRLKIYSLIAARTQVEE